ncbi:phenylalanine--tRNA ligase subunit alpha [Patescibacteria group bacterium]|nr:MAG: phenylalanine--tRNA ligase subunit alpha [Patescibacteria group bacterium]
MIDIKKLNQDSENEIKSVKTADELFVVEKKYLARGDGEVVKLLRQLKDLPVEEKRKIGPEIQELKKYIEDLVNRRRSELADEAQKESEKYFDRSLPGKPVGRGTAHPISQFMDRAEDIFTRLGFETVDEREVDNEFYNFDALNTPKDHPARDIQDTYYVMNPESWSLKHQSNDTRYKIQDTRLLLRTHTSTAQIRAMKDRKPPVRIISPGRVFRHEATDASHETTFNQLEGFVVDKNIRVSDLIGTIKEFFARMYYDKDIKLRVRPHFFPFVEPGMEIDISCIFCNQKGCSVCKHSGWLESAGSGMIHPEVLNNMGVDPKIYSGFAFGFGIDRMVMVYYGIDDIRLLYSGDLRFIKQF